MNQELKDKITKIIFDVQGNYYSSDPECQALQEVVDMINTPDRPALPVIGNYGRYSGGYGTHTLKLQVGDLVLFYSYRTIVAYQDWEDGIVCSVNNWSVTTGKHLNWIQPDHSRRVENFDEMLAAALLRHGIKES